MDVAIIGAGGIAGVHGAAYESMEDVRVTAVVDVRLDKAVELAAIHGARAYSSMEEMLGKEKPDMADICVPTYLHEEMAVRAAEHKIHVLCEKPMALDLESARHMADAAERNGVLLMIAHVIRFWPEYTYLKKAVDEDIYGKLKQASFSRLAQRPDWSWENWMHEPDKSGRAPLDIHIHDADFIYSLLGRPTAVKSVGMEDSGIISYLHTHYFYDNLVVTAEGGWYNSPLPFDMSYRAVFDNAILDFRGGKLMLYPAGGEALSLMMEDKEKTAGGINLPSTNAYHNEISYFIHCIRKGEQPAVVPVRESVECLDMVLKEVLSAKAGREVVL